MSFALAFDAAWLLLLGGAAAWYGHTWRRANRSARRSKHPWWRATSFGAGLALVGVATISPLEHYGNQALWVNFTVFLVLTMLAAPLLLLGAPLTLAFRGATAARRRTLRAFYRHRALAFLTFPAVSWLTFAVVTYLWQWSSLTDLAAEHLAVRHAQLATLLGVSLLFWMPALCADPQRWRMGYPLRVLYVFLEMTHKGLFGSMFLSMNTAFHPRFATNLPAWAPDAITDQRMAILILWIGGNLVFLLVLVGLVIAWTRYEGRNARRTDRRLALQRARERQRKAALERVFRRTA